MSRFDIYNYPRILERTVAKIKEDIMVCEENKEDIIAFSKVKLP